MAKVCEARILREFKTTKVKSVRKDPRFPKYDNLPICGGTISFSVSSIGGCSGHAPEEYCYCSSPEVHVDATCTRCKYPFYEGIDKLISQDASYELERILNDLPSV